MAANNYSGKWHFRHWYPTKDDSAEECGEFDMVGHQTGHTLVLESIKDKHKEAYMLVRLTIDGNVASGSWHEDADKGGPSAGAEYSGAGQMIISDDGNSMDGMWAGAGFDQSLGKLRVYTGRWDLTRQE